MHGPGALVRSMDRSLAFGAVANCSGFRAKFRRDQCGDGGVPHQAGQEIEKPELRSGRFSPERSVTLVKWSRAAVLLRTVEEHII